MKRARTALLLAGLALMLAGCGGGESAGTAGGPSASEPASAPAAGTLSPEAWADQVNAICTQAGGAGGEGGEPPPSGAAATADALDRSAVASDEVLARIGALGAPAGREDEVGAWLDAFARLSDATRAAAAAIRADPDASDSILEDYFTRDVQTLGHTIEQGALELGAYVCAGLDAPPPTVAPVDYAPETRGVVVDTDMAPDDWIALLYLLQRRDVAVRAVTLAGTGEAHCDPGVDNLRRLLTLAGHPKVPVACGRQTPLAGSTQFPAEWRQSVDGMLGLDLPPAAAQTPAAHDAVALLLQAVDASPAPVALLALGPLTNVAEALAADPSLARRLDGIWVMGGAVGVPGNVDGGAAEWNLHVDPAAADAVLRSGAAVTLVALDATSQVPVTLGFLQGLREAHGTTAASFALDVLDAQRASIDGGGYYFWDPLAAAALVDPTLVTVEEEPLVVSLEGDLAGWTSIRSDGVPTKVAVGADRPRFEQTLLSVLNEPG